MVDSWRLGCDVEGAKIIAFWDGPLERGARPFIYRVAKEREADQRRR
jgi:hypothetical protein